MILGAADGLRPSVDLESVVATRVRKLARELRLSPAEVLGLLQNLGYVRYRSTEDQIADVAVDRVREAASKGVRAAPVAPRVEVHGKTPDVADAGEDFMAKILPGVVPLARSDRPVAPRVQEPRPQAPEAGGAVRGIRRDLAEARLEVERAALESLRTDLVEARAGIERARVELAEARSQVEAARLGLEQERIEIEAQRAQLGAGGTTLRELFEARGLRGDDEYQRAWAALAGGRHLGAVLPDLVVVNAARLERLLEDRLVLVGGEVPSSLQGLAAITVAPSRADVPDARVIDRLLRELGEQMLLNGFRRLVVIHAAPRWHRLLREAIDPRVELSFRPVATRELGHELTRSDVVASWRGHVASDLRASWEAVAGRVLEIPDATLAAFLTGLRDRLRSGA